MLESNLDIIFVLFISILSIIGLIKGFLKEIASIFNWFGSAYITKFLKPFFINLFLKNIKFPFLIDLIANSVLFIVNVIIISICTKIIVEKVQKHIPMSVNNSLGFLFGFIKGSLIISLFVACVNMVYLEKKADWFSKSIIFNILNTKENIFNELSSVLLGGFIKEENLNIDDFNKKTHKLKDEVLSKELANKVDEGITKELGDKFGKKLKEKKIKEVAKDLDELVDGLIN